MLFEKGALFLDRDGVINKEKNYLHKISDFEFINGVFNLCRLAIAKGLKIVVVTNQAGIGRGYYSELDFQLLTAWMIEAFSAEGIKLDKVYYCPYHPVYGLGIYKKDSFDRKPQPGMLFRARDELKLCLANSILVGDNLSDIQAAKSAGLNRAIIFSESGFFPHSESIKPDFKSISLNEIAEYLFSD